MDQKRIQYMVERGEIIDTLIAFSRAVDMRDWDACRAILADTVIDDHGTPETLSRDAAIERWRVQLNQCDLIHHVNTNYGVLLDRDIAKVNSEFITTIVAKGAPSGDLLTCGGSCDYDLTRTDAGWNLTGFKAVIKWSIGNADILKEALARPDA